MSSFKLYPVTIYQLLLIWVYCVSVCVYVCICVYLLTHQLENALKVYKHIADYSIGYNPTKVNVTAWIFFYLPKYKLSSNL